jgi:hypothetical protein
VLLDHPVVSVDPDGGLLGCDAPLQAIGAERSAIRETRDILDERVAVITAASANEKRDEHLAVRVETTARLSSACTRDDVSLPLSAQTTQ